jgi:hypothetical protein
MRKVLMVALMVFVFAGSVWADHWRQTSSLLPGTYMLIYIDHEQTTQMVAMQTYAELQGMLGALSFVSVGEALTITINEDYTTARMIEFLNAKPQTTDTQNPMIFKSEGEWWRQIPMPCKWTIGDIGT